MWHSVLGFSSLRTYVSRRGELGGRVNISMWIAGIAVAAVVGLVAALVRAKRQGRVLAAQLDARETELRVLHAAARELLTSVDPARVVTAVERETRRLLSVDRFWMLAVEADPGSQHQLRSFTPALGEFALPPEEEKLLRGIALEKCPVLLHDVEMGDGEGAIHSLLAVPLCLDGRVLGVLAAGSRLPKAFTAAQLELLTTLGQQAASALEHARQHQAATVDSLTGLFLRDYFFRRLQEEFHRSARYGAPFSLLMLDLDAFKEINDRHGHLAGDRYLRALGPALRASLRLADIACRYGGDELCILLPETDGAGGRIIAERIRVAVAELLVDADGTPVRTTASIGLAVHPLHDGGDLKALLRAADQALYRAKRQGRDRVVPWAA